MDAISRVVLFYDPNPLATHAELQAFFRARGVQWRRVLPAEAHETLGRLAGYEGFPARSPGEGAKPAEPVMVFCGFPRDALDEALDALRALPAPPACLKAVLTATNAAWPLPRLAGELRREHRAMHGAG